MSENTRREELFVAEVLNPENTMAEAYRRAYEQHGLSNRDASSRANRLMNEKKVRELLRRRHQEMCSGLQVTAERLEQEVAALAFSKVTDLVSWNSQSGTFIMQMKDSDQLPPEVAAAIKTIKLNKDGNPEVVFHDKGKALEMLAKRYRRFQEVCEDDSARTPQERVKMMTSSEKMARLQELKEKLNGTLD